jgi:hypothetical protein
VILTKERNGTWGSTSSGRRYWPADPRPEDFDIGDIAHALSHTCRYAGHVREFYSVAQHSVLVATEAAKLWRPSHGGTREGAALWGLLHDASEAYLVDIPRPLKELPEMAGYRALERRMMAAICDAFGIPRAMPPSVAVADEVILATEARDLMPPAAVAEWKLTAEPAPWRIEPAGPATAKASFLAIFAWLQREGVAR